MRLMVLIMGSGLFGYLVGLVVERWSVREMAEHARLVVGRSRRLVEGLGGVDVGDEVSREVVDATASLRRAIREWDRSEG